MYIWSNRWITVPEFLNKKPQNLLHKECENISFEHSDDLRNHHTLFRKKVNMPAGFTDAKLYISADDYYMLYVNGDFAACGPANAYHYCYNYNVVDLSQYMHEGENTLLVHVYYQGLLNRVYNSADYRQGMIADLVVDGEQLIDNNWKYSRAREYLSKETYGYRPQFYDIIDNNLAETGRELPEFDDSHWLTAPINLRDDHILVQQITPNVVCEKMLPCKITATEKGYILDFGCEITGVFSAEFYGEENQTVHIMSGEELAEGKVRFNMRCNCDYRDEFILREGNNTYMPYEYKIFRYVEIIVPDGVKVKNMCAYYRHYPFDNITKPPIDNSLLSEIWDICKNAVINCSQEGYLDCPGREKGQYLGDLTVTSHSHMCMNGDTRLLKKALNDFATSAVICPGLMGVVPGSQMQEVADFSLLYPYQMYLYYKYSGDSEFVRGLIPVLDGLLEYFKAYETSEMLIEKVTEKWNLVDWPPAARDEYDFELSRPVGEGYHNVINALYCGAYKYTEVIKDILGIEYEPRYEKLMKSFNDRFYDESCSLYKDSLLSKHHSLHSNVYPLFFGMVPENNRIAELIEEKGFECSPYTAYYILMGLGLNRQYKLIKKLLLNKGEHSWYNMLKEGATTVFEAWGKQQKWNTSLCHAWASAPIAVLKEFPQVLELCMGGQ